MLSPNRSLPPSYPAKVQGALHRPTVLIAQQESPSTNELEINMNPKTIWIFFLRKFLEVMEFGQLWIT